MAYPPRDPSPPPRSGFTPAHMPGPGRASGSSQGEGAPPVGGADSPAPLRAPPEDVDDTDPAQGHPVPAGSPDGVNPTYRDGDNPGAGADQDRIWKVADEPTRGMGAGSLGLDPAHGGGGHRRPVADDADT